MTLAVILVAIIGMVGGVSWSGTALAQGTVPSPESPQQSFVLPPPEEPIVEAGTCGLPVIDTAPASVGDPVTRVLELSSASAQLTSGLNVASYTAELLAPQIVPDVPLPTGYELIGCTVRTTAASTSGTPVVLFRRGQIICFQLQPGYSKYQIYYYDPSPTVNRWVKLGTAVNLEENEACTSPTFRLPAQFGLFGIPI
jgi:hypothetical protein